MQVKFTRGKSRIFFFGGGGADKLGALFGWICVLWWKRKEEKEEAECFGVFPLGYLCSLFGRRYRDSWKDICSPKKNEKNKLLFPFTVQDAHLLLRLLRRW